ncbi:MAG: hypothetical protein IM568_00305 [Flavobacterium sp.]|nr:hypothetical protein [Flavobacterium sp.]
MRTSSSLPEIDYNTILFIIDSLGVKNYTFKIVNHPDDNYKTFHNLVLTDNHDEPKATIMKYEMTEAFAEEYNAGVKTFNEFKGKIKAISPIADPCDPIEINYPIEPIDPNVSNPSGGGGALGPTPGSPTGGNTGGSGGGGSNCASVATTFECSCGDSYSSLSSYFNSRCGDGSNPGYTLTIVLTYYYYICRIGFNPCSPDGSIGVVEPEDKCLRDLATSFVGSMSLAQKDWWQDNSNSSERSEIENYIITNGCGDESKDISKRWIDLKIAIQDNPNLLIDIPCDQIPAWQSLTQFIPPQSVINKIENLDSQFFGVFDIQTISNAKGAAINLDYFPLTINQLPNNPSTGQQFTPTQFLNYIRRNINLFVNTDISEFSPSTITGIDESQIWYSNNPIGAIIHINIPLPAGDGSVICSQYNTTSWTFTTIQVPWGVNQGQDGIHPVSGNREFGIVQNPNGSYTFFSRAADRMTDGLESIIAENGTMFSNPFENPDSLWNSLKIKVHNFVQNNNGSSITPSSNENRIWRPAWNKVRQYLRGEVSISELGCN